MPRLTSPRSIKACLDLGVDPKQLAPVSIDGYRDDQVDAQIWMLRYQHAQDLRDSLMVKLCALRLSYDAEAIAKQFRPSTGAGSNAEVLAAESTTEQRATERVERLQEKQRKLASTRVEALNESVQMQKSLEGKIGRVDDMLEKRQEARRLAENTRVNTLLLSSMQQSAAVREADLEEAYEAGEHFRIEQEKLAAARRREAQQRQEVKESVVRNAEKEREWRRRHQAVVAEQAAVADASRRTIEAGERRRQKLKKVRDAERAEAMAATAAEFQQRLNKAKSVAESQQGGQRDMLLEREVKASLRRKAMTVERGQELELERARNKEKEEIRQQIKKEADRTQEERLSRIVSEADEAARKLEELKVAQELKRQLTLTERHLSVGDRKMRTEMQQKQGALHRFTLKQKIDRDDVRVGLVHPPLVHSVRAPRGERATAPDGPHLTDPAVTAWSNTNLLFLTVSICKVLRRSICPH